MSEQTTSTEKAKSETAPPEAWQDPVCYLRRLGLESSLVETVVATLDPAA